MQIDTVRQMQKDSTKPFVYANDSGIVKSPCPLTWLGPINEATLLGQYPPGVVGDTCLNPFCAGVPVDTGISDGSDSVVAPEIRGKTIADIVGSFKSGRSTDDSQGLCSSCHYTGAPNTIYRPPVGYNEAESIRPDQSILFYRGLEKDFYRAWAGQSGWAWQFIGTTQWGTGHKPEYLRQLFRKWMADGSQ